MSNQTTIERIITLLECLDVQFTCTDGSREATLTDKLEGLEAALSTKAAPFMEELVVRITDCALDNWEGNNA